MSIQILIGADIVPTSSNTQAFIQADVNTLLGKELFSLLKQADYTLFNLETPLMDTRTPIAKNGPCLSTPTATINGLKKINPHFFTLANNHIMDQGVLGLQSTLQTLQKAGIAYAGVGENLTQAEKPYIVEIKGVKLGIYCCAEHEFSIATVATAGANPYDPLTSFDSVRNLKNQCDVVVVLYHGGKEHYRYPSPQLQRAFRKFAQCGASVVIAQHTHCIGCMEEYNGATLIYGQGNFLFSDENGPFWDTSLLVQLNIDEKTHAYSISFIPCIQFKNGQRLANTQQANEILAGFRARSQEIQQKGFVEEQYNQFVQKFINNYLQIGAGWLGNNLPIRILNKLTKYRLFTYLYRKKDLLPLQNMLRCEAHYELFQQAIKELLGKK